MDGNDIGDISTRSIERVKSGLKASEDEMTDAEVNDEEETEVEEMEDEDSTERHIDPKLAFIDQQIELHLTRYVRRRISDLQMLRIRSHGDEYIPPNLTDEQLVVYLFAMHYNIARTVSLLRSNYKLRTKIPSFFTSRSVTETNIQDVWNVLVPRPLKDRILNVSDYVQILQGRQAVGVLSLNHNDKTCNFSTNPLPNGKNGAYDILPFKRLEVEHNKIIISITKPHIYVTRKVGVFPKKTNTHQHIVYIGLRNHDPERFKAHSVLKLFLMCMDVYHILEGLPCCIIAILDGAGASYGYFNRDNYEHLKIAIKYVQESMPYNVEQIHVVNTSLTIKAVFKVLKPFLTKDIISSIHFHSDNDLKKFLPARCLPAEYGGTAPGSIDEYQASFRQRLEMLQEFFDMEEEQRATYYFPKENTA